MWFLAATWLVLPVASDFFTIFFYLHVAKLAYIAKTAVLLPKAAHNLATHGSLAVPERAGIALAAG